jgi:glutamine cyclotransferase
VPDLEKRSHDWYNKTSVCLNHALYQPTRCGSVLNGIAYDQQTGRLFVMGKNWPNHYEITIAPAE